jgi:transposase-like protein
MGKKSSLTPEQRAQLVLRLLSKEEPAVQIARRAGISEQTLYRWRDEFIGAGKQALHGRGNQAEQRKAVERLNRDIAERDRVIGELTIANRVLKNPPRAASAPPL